MYTSAWKIQLSPSLTFHKSSRKSKNLNVNKSLEHPAAWGKEHQKHVYLLMCSCHSKTGHSCHIYSFHLSCHSHIVNRTSQSVLVRSATSDPQKKKVALRWGSIMKELKVTAQDIEAVESSEPAREVSIRSPPKMS